MGTYILAAAVAGSGPDAGTALLVAVVGLAAAAVSGVITYLAQRRQNSGKITTSPAEVVFNQMQHMVDVSEARAAKAEDQRDKLIESQGASVAPSLAEISTGLRFLAEMVQSELLTSQRVEELAQRIEELLTDTGRADATDRAIEKAPPDDHL